MNNYNSIEWNKFLDKSLTDLLNETPLSYKTDIIWSKLPEKAGVYLISEFSKPQNEIALYIGRTKNLRNRIYRNHLMGSTTNARLKNYIIKDENHSCYENVNLAKEYIRDNCFVRWILVENMKERGALESFFTAKIFPKYGISEEH